MCAKHLPRAILDAHKVALRTRLLDLIKDRFPHESLRRVVRRRRLATDTQHRANGRLRRLLIPQEEDHRRSPVPRDVSATRVDCCREIPLGEELRDELLAKLALHKRVRGDLAHEARRPGALRGQCEFNEPFHERTSQRILAAATSVELAIRLIEILGRVDVRRISHHRVKTLRKDLARCVVAHVKQLRCDRIFRIERQLNAAGSARFASIGQEQ